jgi:hypothetical protein
MVYKNGLRFRVKCIDEIKEDILIKKDFLGLSV